MWGTISRLFVRTDYNHHHQSLEFPANRNSLDGEDTAIMDKTSAVAAAAAANHQQDLDSLETKQVHSLDIIITLPTHT